MVSEEAQSALSFVHADNMAWYIVRLIYDSFLNILIYEMWDGMKSLETKGRGIYKVLLWNVFGATEEKQKNGVMLTNNVVQMWFQDPHIQSRYSNFSIAKFRQFHEF